MQVFIIRPFGVKNIQNDKTGSRVDIDFDAVEEKLIQPALQKLGLKGGTSGQIMGAGNIRLDMFEKLMAAELVIADVSIHNANVFYELGIRHALRNKRTFLIHNKTQKLPFDLSTERYLAYDSNAPEASLDGLTQGLRETLESAATSSPVFLLLRNLKEQDLDLFLPAPDDFAEAVKGAEEGHDLGLLRLMAQEVQDKIWAVEGLRRVGEIQFRQKDLPGARVSFEALLQKRPTDVAASLRLATIYQKLNALSRSDIALERVLNQADLSPDQRAEACSLKGSNAKTRWVNAWQSNADIPLSAICSGHGDEALNAYMEAFASDLNHFYAGINALALSIIFKELAQMLPQKWQDAFESPKKAADRLDALKEQVNQLAGTVGFVIAAQQKKLQQQGKKDVWLDFTLADLICLTAASPGRVESAYRQAQTHASAFHIDAALRQLEMLQALGILKDNVASAIAVLKKSPGFSSAPGGQEKSKPCHVVVFTGHMIDQPGRSSPRFPADMEFAARRAIRMEMEKLKADYGESLLGMAGCACGGDILFHEVCEDLAIAHHIYLALPKEAYIEASVFRPASNWLARFHQLLGNAHTPVRYLSDKKELPDWLGREKTYTLWERNNLWILQNALAMGGSNVTLIALHDASQPPDGPGGTGHMMEIIGQNGADVRILDTGRIFGGN
ncbi:tetratricopeptide repeat-containing protein [Desulfobotulus sp.]|uniref:tetratricopeptide repeat-containing protein n=1 Tax=Desulfobotulus sp. TaxID=1940337 RepID=UPI002A35C80F|nr:tetratricopeptide repeat-containing protein [Desulfobotulus sp.]MDY0164496.1 hypothetical protein [Desulfobotulus sp.]